MSVRTLWKKVLITFHHGMFDQLINFVSREKKTILKGYVFNLIAEEFYFFFEIMNNNKAKKMVFFPMFILEMLRK